MKLGRCWSGARPPGCSRLMEVGVFKLGGNGGDHEWYEAHLIRGTVHMRNYDGKAKIISAQPTPSNGWSTYFSIEPEMKDDIMDLLGHGKKRLSKKGKKKKTRKAKVAQVAKAKADKAKAAKAKPTLTRTTSAPPARKAPKNGKTPIRRSNTLGGNKNVGKGRARTLHKCMLQPPNRRPKRCPQSEAHDTFVQADPEVRREGNDRTQGAFQSAIAHPGDSNDEGERLDPQVQREGNDVKYPSCHTPFAHPVTRSRARSERCFLYKLIHYFDL